MSRVYLDYNATAPLRPEARDAMLSAMDVVGNPSSVHAEGRAAKGLVEKARGQVAAAVGCKPQEVVFTSGATEAARVLANPTDGYDVFVEETAHDALWAQASMSSWPKSPNGPGHTLALGVANSETGVLLDIPEKVEGQYPFGHARADWLMLDVTQMIGRVAFAFGWSGADFAILSAHKLGGPKGVGALIVREGLDIFSLAEGGGQEMGRRSGTENVIGIAGFGAAAEAAQRDLEAGVWGEVKKLRKILEKAIEESSSQTIFVGKDAPRLPNTSCFITPGWKGETQVMAMDLAGFAISAGSACSSGKVKASRVLAAMGFDEVEAASAIRVSLGPQTTEDEVRAFAAAWTSAYEKFRARSA
ncbi:cysteine desulfurase family protein [Roseovarius rhodophyticola]|uniref:Cysteine desulfurase n=1 Tax=Roseovarius rhodophyticola TaxID=3080827 RepID=A0ABZ2TJ74_9RHOB|nr:cysteine desulfurase family protein [Roseovarius sp. W115]MDV2928063.1 cysteine desulfurase family protein [Roseovarius sp. W115]